VGEDVLAAPMFCAEVNCGATVGMAHTAPYGRAPEATGCRRRELFAEWIQGSIPGLSGISRLIRVQIGPIGAQLTHISTIARIQQNSQRTQGTWRTGNLQ
jgi:hypothetical protein